MGHYKNQEVTYILRGIVKEFIGEFYKGIIDGHNRAIGLVLRL